MQAWIAVPLMRQPVSPITTMRRGLATGSLSVTPSITAAVPPIGIEASHCSTGNAAVGVERGCIATGVPSTASAGQLPDAVMARASTVLLGASWIQRFRVCACAGAWASSPASAVQASNVVRFEGCMSGLFSTTRLHVSEPGMNVC